MDRTLDVAWLESLWRPDSIIKNAKKVAFEQSPVPNHYLWLYRDKRILYVTKSVFVIKKPTKKTNKNRLSRGCYSEQVVDVSLL